MRSLLLALALLTAVPAAAQAVDTPEARRETARQMVEAVNLGQLLSDTMNAMRGQLIAAIRRGAPALTEPQVAGAVDDILMPEFHLRRGELVDAFVALYADRMTVEEMRYAISFYTHPLGQRVLRLMPEMAVVGGQLGEAWAVRVGTDAIAKHREALRARGVNL